MKKIDRELVMPHLHFTTEWWYFTGFLNGQFGFEVAIFLSNPKFLPMSVYFPFVKSFLAHFAVTDIEKKVFAYNERTKTADLSRLSKGDVPLNIKIGEISVMSNGNDYLLNANSDEYTLSLLLQSTKPPVTHGENGIIHMGSGSSYYYSLPNMHATGVLRRGNEFLSVKGSAWHDHQFGNFSVNGTGWQWFSLHLHGDIELMSFILQDKAGNIQKYIALILPDGNKKLYDDFSVETLKHNGVYGTEWKLKFSDGEFIIKSMQDNQIVRSKIPSVPEYAEMLSSVSGKIFGKQTQGYAYVEIKNR